MGRIWLDKLGYRLCKGGGTTNTVGLCSTATERSDPLSVGSGQLEASTTLLDARRAHYAQFPCFTDKLGTYVGDPVHIPLKSDAVPVFLKARPVPIPRQIPVSRKLDELERLTAITKVHVSEWATPIVVVPKKGAPGEGGSDVISDDLRLCGDYRSTVNSAILVEPSTQDAPEQLFTKLAGASWFSRLDMRMAYTQLRLTEESSMVLTINTINGLYKVNRLPFGIASAPAIFARIMKKELNGLDGVVSFLDDILVFAGSEEELLTREETLLTTLSNLGFALNLQKCKFGLRSIRYLGFKISGSGLAPLPDRVQDLQRADAPTNPQELRSWLGHLAF